ncbi:hypothetical protein D3C78_1963730 [compost metagenome]
MVEGQLVGQDGLARTGPPLNDIGGTHHQPALEQFIEPGDAGGKAVELLHDAMHLRTLG